MQLFLYIIFYILVLFILLKVVSTFISLFYGSPSGETPNKLAFKIFKYINPKKGQIVYDLGCGIGNVGVTITKNFNVRVIGFEISPLPYLVSKIRSLFVKNLEVKFKNIKKINLSRANVVYCFLMPELLAKLAPKLKRELKKGSIVISLIFKIKGLRENKIIKLGNKKYYIYII